MLGVVLILRCTYNFTKTLSWGTYNYIICLLTFLLQILEEHIKVIFQKMYNSRKLNQLA